MKMRVVLISLFLCMWGTAFADNCAFPPLPGKVTVVIKGLPVGWAITDSSYNVLFRSQPNATDAKLTFPFTITYCRQGGGMWYHGFFRGNNFKNQLFIFNGQQRQGAITYGATFYSLYSKTGQGSGGTVTVTPLYAAYGVMHYDGLAYGNDVYQNTFSLGKDAGYVTATGRHIIYYFSINK